MIKFLDITKQDKKIHKIILGNIKKIIKKNSFILGEEVLSFEKNFSKYCNSKYAVSCANGTDALTIALKVLNLPKNSEVIMPAMTYCSTAFAIINAGLNPVLADIENNRSTISINEIKKRITNKTRVIMPVHLYGSCANIDEIKKIIKNKKIYLIDDCAQAHGSKYKDKRVGSLGDISCFSLYPGKNLGAYGDAGIITTNNKKFYNMIKSLRNLGSTKKFMHDHIGVNSRLDTVQAIILNKKLKYLKKLNLKRRKIANLYNKNILNDKITKLIYSKSCVYHQYVILVNDRNKFIKYLQKSKIQYGFHYPFAIHQLKVFKNYFNGEKFPNAEILSKNGISIPIDPNLTKKEISFIINKLNNFK